MVSLFAGDDATASLRDGRRSAVTATQRAIDPATAEPDDGRVWLAPMTLERYEVFTAPWGGDPRPERVRAQHRGAAAVREVRFVTTEEIVTVDLGRQWDARRVSEGCGSIVGSTMT